MVTKNQALIAATIGLSGASLYVASLPIEAEDPLKEKKEAGQQNIAVQPLDAGNVIGAGVSGSLMPGIELFLDGVRQVTDSSGRASWLRVGPGLHTLTLGNADKHHTDIVTHDGFMVAGMFSSTRTYTITETSSISDQPIIHEKSLQIEVGLDADFVMHISVSPSDKNYIIQLLDEFGTSVGGGVTSDAKISIPFTYGTGTAYRVTAVSQDALLNGSVSGFTPAQGGEFSVSVSATAPPPPSNGGGTQPPRVLGDGDEFYL